MNLTRPSLERIGGELRGGKGGTRPLTLSHSGKAPGGGGIGDERGDSDDFLAAISEKPPQSFSKALGEFFATLAKD